MKNIFKIVRNSIPVLFLVLFISSCGSTGSTKVSYVEPDATPNVITMTFQTKDLQLLAQKMVQSLLETPIFGTERPLIRISRVKNKTDEHINTKAVTDKIRTQLIKSGKIRFLQDVSEKAQFESVLEEQEFARSEFAKKGGRNARSGQMLAAKFHMFGEIISMREREGRHRELYFKFTLSLQNTETGVLEWADEKEIKKAGKQSAFGR